MIPRDHWGLLQSTKCVVHTWVDLLPLISQASLAKDGESGKTRICLRRGIVAGAMGSKSSFRSVVCTVWVSESSLVVTDVQNPWYSLLLQASVVKRHRLWVAGPPSHWNCSDCKSQKLLGRTLSCYSRSLWACLFSVLPVGRSGIGNPKHIFLEHRHKLDFSPKDLLSFPRHQVLRTQVPSVSTHQLTLEEGFLGEGCRLWGPLHMCLHVSLRCKPTASICSGTEPCLPFFQQVPLPLCSSVCVLAGSVSENSRWGGSRVSLAWRRQRLWAQWSVPVHHAGSQSGPCGAMRGEGSPQDEVSFHCGARERSQKNSCCMHVLSDSPRLW